MQATEASVVSCTLPHLAAFFDVRLNRRRELPHQSEGSSSWVQLWSLGADEEVPLIDPCAAGASATSVLDPGTLHQLHHSTCVSREQTTSSVIYATSLVDAESLGHHHHYRRRRRCLPSYTRSYEPGQQFNRQGRQLDSIYGRAVSTSVRSTMLVKVNLQEVKGQNGIWFPENDISVL
ncbi:hypothetical protein NPX13_g4200 [Xylaria arbuscula]|uniref:Uncharacterized protein n=1 Tax=Xylaria arbuscula TaxID=114810 RepID=A0A9W8TNK2_9PEZI|nr:hypothetical protein NPX13_g4200 [Xylaria arbuscula]